jgi:hypothetical protein
MEDLGAANKKHEYGRHRMWGSIGFGGTPLAAQFDPASSYTDARTTRDTTRHDQRHDMQNTIQQWLRD